MNKIDASNDTEIIESSIGESCTDDEYFAKEISSNNQIISTDINHNYIESSNISHHLEKLQLNSLGSKAAQRKRQKRRNQLVALIEKLTINPGSSKVNDVKELTGEITSILYTLGLVLIQPQSPTIVLDIDTPLYIRNPDSQNPNNITYILLGPIDDVFGQILEPRYSVSYTRESTGVLKIGASVYCNSNDPKSHLHCVRNVISHRIEVLPRNEHCKDTRRSKRRKRKGIPCNHIVENNTGSRFCQDYF